MPTTDAVPTSRNVPEPPQERLRRIDAERPGFPGELLIVFGAGAWLMLAGIRSGLGLYSANF